MSSSYPTRQLGKTGVYVSASNSPFIPLRTLLTSVVGFGAMGMSSFYGPTKGDEENFKVLSRAVDIGVTLWDTADMYSWGKSEGLYPIYTSLSYPEFKS